MTRGTLRGLAAGILFSTAIFGALFFIEDEKQSTSLGLKEIQAESEKLGYKLVKKTEDSRKEVSSPKKDTVTKETPKPLEDTQKKSTNNVQTTYKLRINSGMTSEQIGSLLQQNGIITDASAFIKQLETSNLSTEIQVGEYVVSKEMSLKQIINTITK